MATVQRKGAANSFDALTNSMLVLEEGATSGIARPSSGSSISKTSKKPVSSGLIVLSADPDNASRQSATDVQASEKEGRVSSAGRIEKRLELARKTLDEDDKERTGSAEKKPQTVLPLNRHSDQQTVPWNSSTRVNHPVVPHQAHAPQAETKVTLGAVAGPSQDNNAEETDSSSSDDSSDEDDEDEDEDPSRPPAVDGAPSSDGPKAPIELTAQFLNLVMTGEYHQAQELCHQILLLEPDNVTCQEFLTVIAEKIQQDEESEDSEEDDEGDDDEDGDDDSSDDDDDDSDDDDDDDDDSGRESDDEDSSDSDVELPPGPVNLIMGGLPVIPQPQDNQE